MRRIGVLLGGAVVLLVAGGLLGYWATLEADQGWAEVAGQVLRWAGVALGLLGLAVVAVRVVRWADR